MKRLSAHLRMRLCTNKVPNDEDWVRISNVIFFSLAGGAASIAGVLLNTIPNNEDGTFSLKEFESKIRGGDALHEPKTSMVVVENTHNLTGGKVIPLEWMDELAPICKRRNIKMHMDGARVFHAAEYLNVPVSRIARDFDSVTFCLSKSLCAPMGSILVGSRDFIEYARCMRRVLGGGVPQLGIVAAAGLVALEDILPRLGDDHRHTKQIAQAIYDMESPYVTVDIDRVQTNICFINFPYPEKYSAQYFLERLLQINNQELSAGITDDNGIGIVIKSLAPDEQRCLRIVLYHHIDDELTQLVIKKIQYCIEELSYPQTNEHRQHKVQRNEKISEAE